MGRNYTDNNTPQKGMVQDVNPAFQPDGTYRFALNTVNITDSGEQGFVGIEPGNTACYDLPNDYYVIGSIPLVDNKAVLFLVSSDNERSEIGVGDNFCNYTTIINSTCLGFTKENQIQGTHSIVNGCETVVYFTSPTMYAINITNYEQYLLSGYTQSTANTDGEGWDCELLKQFPNYDRPTLSSFSVNDAGGDLPLGTYQIITSYLDSASNSIGWFDFTHPIPVTDESFTAGFETIDGGFNSDVPPTNKSITVTYDNVDTSYKYLRIALVASNDGVRTGYLIYDVPITSSTLSYTITTLTNAEEIDINNLIISPVVYEEAKTVTQINNRLLYGNLIGKQIDHAAFQQAANSIKTVWFAEQLQGKNISGNNYKSPSSFVETKGYMRDEVYAMGIVFLFKDGYVTPVYHIPGREKNTGHGDYFVGNVLPAASDPNIHNRKAPVTGWDDTVYTVVNSTTTGASEVYVGDVEHLGLAVADTVERWEVFNTATKTSGGAFHREGELAYWESDLEYPDTTDCNGDRVYPSGKIRYHKMPDTTLMYHADGDYNVYPLGLRFTNIDVPAAYTDQVTGFMIVRVKRDFSNSSVIDKGMFTQCIRVGSTPIIHQCYPYNDSRQPLVNIDRHFQGFHGPVAKFDRNALNASHVKFEKILYGTSNYEISDTALNPDRYVSWTSLDAFEDTKNPEDYNTNRRIDIQVYADADSVIESTFGADTFDNTEQQEVLALNLTTPAQPLAPLGHLTAGLSDGDDVNFLYGSVKKYLPQQYGSLSNLVYIPVQNSFETYAGTVADINVYGGDCFISELTFRRTALIEAMTYLPINHDDPDITLAGSFCERHVVGYFVESTINCGYRNEGDLDTEVYYPKTYYPNVARFAELELWTSDDSTDMANRYLDLIPNYYEINPDFNQENDVKIYIPLPSSFDYCSSCLEEFKTRIIYSEVKSIESTQDAFRVFLPNNYVDLPQNKGELTNLFVNDYKLFAHTENSLFSMLTSPQTIETDEATTYLGNAAFLSLEPQELKSIVEGYLGSKHQWATCTSEYGTLFVSKDRLFLMQDGMIEISNMGMRQFFIDNKLIFGESFRELMLDFSSSSTLEFSYLDNPANPHGVGFIACFDREKRRFIIHKRDYKILFGVGTVDEPIGFWGTKNTNIEYLEGAIVYNADTGWFEQAGPVISSNMGSFQNFTELEFSDTTLFENKSYTISYDPNLKQWISFHSYLPNFMFNTYDKWYTFSTEYMGSVYEHNTESFQRYYGQFKDHIIELVMSEDVLRSSVAKSVSYVSRALKYNSTYNQWVDVPYSTFTDVWLYNTSQSSDILSITVANNNGDPFLSIDYTDGETIVFKAEQTWRFNRFSNLVSDTSIPFATSSWTDISSDFFIDKLPNPLAHSTGITLYEREKFRDKFLIVRLIHSRSLLDGKGNLDLHTQYIFGNMKLSNR